MIDNDNTNVRFIFPTAIYMSQIGNYEEYNKLLLDNIDNYNFETKTEADKFFRLTGEHLGKINIHHNTLFNDFFKHIALHAKSYVNFLGIKDELFDYYINKTWLSIVDDPVPKINYHSHSNSDISFIYYIEIPENPDCINFSNVHKPNELFQGMMDDSTTVSKTFFRERNEANYNGYHIVPEEGLLVMWPGHIPHGTIKNPYDDKDQVGRRCGLAGDISIVLKPGYNDFESGRISLDYMRKFF